MVLDCVEGIHIGQIDRDQENILKEFYRGRLLTAENNLVQERLQYSELLLEYEKLKKVNKYLTEKVRLYYNSPKSEKE